MKKIFEYARREVYMSRDLGQYKQFVIMTKETGVELIFDYDEAEREVYVFTTTPSFIPSQFTLYNTIIEKVKELATIGICNE